MSERIHLSVWVPEGEDKVKLVYSDDEVIEGPISVRCRVGL